MQPCQQSTILVVLEWVGGLPWLCTVTSTINSGVVSLNGGCASSSAIALFCRRVTVFFCVYVPSLVGWKCVNNETVWLRRTYDLLPFGNCSVLFSFILAATDKMPWWCLFVAAVVLLYLARCFGDRALNQSAEVYLSRVVVLLR